MTDRQDAAERLQLLLSRAAGRPAGGQVTVDDLDGDATTVRTVSGPDFTDPTAAEPCEQLVARDRLGAGFAAKGHGPVRGGRRLWRKCTPGRRWGQMGGGRWR